MKVVAIIQARMGSTRLPGKVLLTLGTKSVLAWVVDAAKAMVGVDDVIVATSHEAQDDSIAKWCKEHRTLVYRGSEDDVLDRFMGAAKATKAEIVVRITADCPFFDPWVGGEVIRLFKSRDVSYASNVLPPTWADGLDCEVIAVDALTLAHKEAKLAQEREHVTPFIYHRQAQFSVANLVCSIPHMQKERWTLDTQQDFEFLQAVAKHYNKTTPPSYLEILQILERNPKLKNINTGQQRNESFLKQANLPNLSPITCFEHSAKLLKRAEKVIPLGSQTFSKSKVQYPEGQAPLFLTHGVGGKVWDVDGNEYVDLVSALLPVVLGYNDPDINDAIRMQLGKGISFSLATELEAELAEKLVEIIPCAEKIRFGKNGSDVTTAAVRIARAYTKRDHIIVCGYHGWHDWYIGSTARNKGVPEAVQGLTHKVLYNDLDAVEVLLKQYPHQIAGLVMEPMNVAEPAPHYLKDLKALLHKHGTLLIFDEVVTGFRFALGGAQELFGVTPDLAAFGKALGNGMPISAIVGKAEIMDIVEEIFFSGTFGGEALSLAAAIALINKMQREPVIPTLWTVGKLIRQEAEKLIQLYKLDSILSFKGQDCWKILAIEAHQYGSVEAIKTLFMREMIRNGVLTIGTHNVNYAHTNQDSAKIISAYHCTLEKIAYVLNKNTMDTELGGRLLQPIFKVR